MILGFITLLISIAISAVAAYYSILGLVAIFAAAAMPIIIMGGVLEAGKLMAAVWLHKNWKKASFVYKAYLVPAVLVLMLLTSMGVFGFLSKAHLDQGIPTADVEAKVQMIDVRIKAQTENINVAQKTLDQLDTEVNEILARSKNEAGVRRATQLRTSQAKERGELQTSIDEARAQIAKLNEEKAIITAKLRQLIAEVGPVKYVAELIYGNESTENTLDKAIRWVIIMIVGVFDPLAIVLLLAATKQFEWAALDRKKRREEKIKQDHNNDEQKYIDLESKYNTEVKLRTDLEKSVEELSASLLSLTNERTTMDSELSDLRQKYESVLAQRDLLESSGTDSTEEKEKLVAEIDLLKKSIEIKTQEIAAIQKAHDDKAMLLTAVQNDLDELIKVNRSTLTHAHEINQENSDLKFQLEAVQKELESARNDVVLLNHAKDMVEQALDAIKAEQAEREQRSEVVEVAEELEVQQFDIPTTPIDYNAFVPVEELQEPEPQPTQQHEVSVVMDVEFTPNPNKGDLCIRVDFTPSKLFKWNGDKWINVPKENTDSYLSCDDYIEFMKAALSNGTYTIDDLTPQEQQLVRSKK